MSGISSIKQAQRQRFFGKPVDLSALHNAKHKKVKEGHSYTEKRINPKTGEEFYVCVCKKCTKKK